MATRASVWSMTIEPPSGSGHVPALDLGDLVLDAVLVEQRDLLVVELEPVDEAGHDDLEEVLGPLEGRGLVDPDRVDLRGEDIPDRPDDHVRFLIDRRRCAGLLDAAEDDLPEPQEIGEVAGQLALGPLEPGGPDDEAQSLGGIELEHDLAELAALALVDDLPRDADAIEAGHQHEVAARDADVGREGRALGADALLDDLDEDLVAAAEDLLDRGLERPASATGPAAAAGLLAGLVPGPPRRPISRSSSSISSISLRISCSSSGSISSSATMRVGSSPANSSSSRSWRPGPPISSRSSSSSSSKDSTSGRPLRANGLRRLEIGGEVFEFRLELIGRGDERRGSRLAGRRGSGSRRRPRRRRRRRPSGRAPPGAPVPPLRGDSHRPRPGIRRHGAPASSSSKGSISRSVHSVSAGKRSSPKGESPDRSRSRRGM